MTPEEIVNLLKPKIREALAIVADFIIAEALKWIPIHSGDLRRSTVKRFEGDLRIILQSGEGLPYATAQYFGFSSKSGPEHLLSEGKPIKIIDSGKAKIKAGMTDKQRYSSAYRQIKDEMQTLSGFSDQPRWFERVLDDKDFRNKLRRIFIRALQTL